MTDWNTLVGFKRDLLDTAEKAIREKKGYTFEFVIEDWTTDFLRFYRNQTNYNITKNEITMTATVERDKRKYTFVLSNPSPDTLAAALDDACGITDKLPPDEDFVSFEDNRDIYKYDSIADSRDAMPLSDKVELLREMAGSLGDNDYKLYGSFITLRVFRHILNSHIPVKHFYQSPVMLDVKAVSDKTMSTVIESFGGNDFTLFDRDEFTARLRNKIGYSLLPVKDTEPGGYDVILSPHAVAQLLEFLIMGAYAQNLDNGTSFFEGKTGQKTLSDKLTAASDPHHQELINFPYHREGSVTGRLAIVEKGVFKSFITDHYYSKKLNIPKNCSVGTNALTIEPGAKSLAELTGMVKRGIYISNIHYMNFINEKETSVTGLTRDGTFLIEDGKIANTAPNLRYTVKLSDVFTNIIELENRRYTIPQSQNYDNFQLYSSAVPHILTAGFKISSSSHTV
jgi:predicted Zn-dependent protease